MTEYILQTKHGNEEGNCLSACVSSLYGIPIDDVPVFVCDYSWLHKFSEWCVEKLHKYCVSVEFTEEWHLALFCDSEVIVSIIVDKEENRHAVIAKNGKIIFDPMVGKVNLPITEDMCPHYLLFCDYK